MALNQKDKKCIRNLKSGGRKRRVQLMDLMNEFRWLIDKGVHEHKLSREDFKEIHNETFLIFDKKVQNGTFEEKASIKTFIISIFSTLTVNELKKRATKKRIPIEKLTFELEGAADGDIQMFMRSNADQELITMAKNFINKLDKNCRKILQMWGFQGFDMEEIALRMGYSSAGVARVRKHGCLKKLRLLIEENLKS